MTQLIAVGAGGFVGAVLRHLMGGWLQKTIATPWLPVGTLGVNVLGCFALGILGGWAEYADFLNTSQRLFLLVGLLGGFTTFSTFSFETLALMRSGQISAGLANMGIQLAFGMLAVWGGFALSAFKLAPASAG